MQNKQEVHAQRQRSEQGWESVRKAGGIGEVWYEHASWLWAGGMLPDYVIG